MGKRYKCDCCGFYTLVGTDVLDVLWNICPVCFWENDVSGTDPDEYSCANHMTLAQGRVNYLKCSACEITMIGHVRLPIPKEFPDNNKDTE